MIWKYFLPFYGLSFHLLDDINSDFLKDSTILILLITLLNTHVFYVLNNILSIKQGLVIVGFPGGASGKERACQCRRHKRRWFDSWVGKIPWGRAWQSTLVFLPRESHGQRNLVGYSPYGHRESDMIEET